jgi:Fur family ferric uptake transcriptional regulator
MVHGSKIKADDFVKQFTAELKNRNYRITNQRLVIAECFAEQGGHLTVDELYRFVSDQNPEVGYATVYRTLRLLVDCDLAETHQFDQNRLSFEIHDPEGHHDHLICVSPGCNLIFEFENEGIEALQEEVARQHNFQLKSHRMELYGICEKCQEASKH